MPSSQPLRQFEAALLAPTDPSVCSAWHTLPSLVTGFSRTPAGSKGAVALRHDWMRSVSKIAQSRELLQQPQQCQGCRTRRYQRQGKGAEAITDTKGANVLVATHTTICEAGLPKAGFFAGPESRHLAATDVCSSHRIAQILQNAPRPTTSLPRFRWMMMLRYGTPTASGLLSW